MQDAVGMDSPELLVKGKPQITRQVLRSRLSLSKPTLLCREADAGDATTSESVGIIRDTNSHNAVGKAPGAYQPLGMCYLHCVGNWYG